MTEPLTAERLREIREETRRATAHMAAMLPAFQKIAHEINDGFAALGRAWMQSEARESLRPVMKRVPKEDGDRDLARRLRRIATTDTGGNDAT